MGVPRETACSVFSWSSPGRIGGGERAEDGRALSSSLSLFSTCLKEEKNCEWGDGEFFCILFFFLACNSKFQLEIDAIRVLCMDG